MSTDHICIHFILLSMVANIHCEHLYMGVRVNVTYIESEWFCFHDKKLSVKIMTIV